MSIIPIPREKAEAEQQIGDLRGQKYTLKDGYSVVLGRGYDESYDIGLPRSHLARAQSLNHLLYFCVDHGLVQAETS